MKRKNRSGIARKLLVLWSKKVRERDKYICQKCGKAAREAHHIIARRRGVQVWWFNLDNGVSLCAGCHKFHGAHSVNFEEQKEFNAWVKRWLKMRDTSYEELEIKCSSRKPLKTFEIEVLYEEMRK